jgi:hypothetical protein
VPLAAAHVIKGVNVRPSYPWLVLVSCAGASLVIGCPQLARDDFRDAEAAGTGGTGGAGAPSGMPDAAAGLGGDAGEAPDAAPAPLTPEQTLRAALAHRYDMSGSGSTAVDSAGSNNAFIYNTQLTGTGYLALNGSAQYMSLENGLISSGNNKTVEAWLSWRGGDAWQRIFDFGSSDAGEREQGNGVSYLYLTPMSDTGVALVGFSISGFPAELRLAGTTPVPTDTLSHVAVVVDGAHNTLSLYRDGALDTSTTLTQRLVSIVDLNLWIGHSQFAGDPDLDADVMEFRIYDQALDAAQVALSYQLGPDGLPATMP